MQKKFYKIDPGPMPAKVLPILTLIIKIFKYTQKKDLQDWVDLIKPFWHIFTYSFLKDISFYNTENNCYINSMVWLWLTQYE